MTTLDYDRYWERRKDAGTRARSEARAALALQLLGSGAAVSPEGDRPRLLDVGCGPGWALEMFAAAGYDASGVDVSRRAVEEARSRGLRAQVGSLDDGLPGGEYELIVALEVLEHLVDPLRALVAFQAALAPGGRMVISLPNEFHLLGRLALLVGRSPFGGHEDPHLRYFDDRLARRLFSAAGLRVIGRRSDSLVPPRWRILRRLTSPAVKLLPGLFALSNVYVLAPSARGVRDEN